MIIYKSPELKLFVTELKEQLANAGIKVKQARLHEIIAKSQSFNTYAAFKTSYPIMLDTSKSATNTFLINVEKYGIKSDSFKKPSSSIFENAAMLAKPFPLVAPQNHCIQLRIDWFDGEILFPEICPLIAQNSGTPNERLGRCAYFNLAGIVFEDEYRELCDRIKPYVQQVADGYDEHASNTQLVKNSYLEIDNIFDEFEFRYNSSEGSAADDIFGDDVFYEENIYEDELTSVEIGNQQISHSSSDVDLRQLVGIYLEDEDYPVAEETLFYFLKNLRDACCENAKRL